MGTLALLRSATAHKRLESFAGICDASAGGGISFAFNSWVLYECRVLNMCSDMFPAWGLCERRYLASRSAVAGLRALCTATRATERERPHKEHIAAPPLAFFQETFYSRSDKTYAEYHYDKANIPDQKSKKLHDGSRYNTDGILYPGSLIRRCGFGLFVVFIEGIRAGNGDHAICSARTSWDSGDRSRQ